MFEAKWEFSEALILQYFGRLADIRETILSEKYPNRFVGWEEKESTNLSTCVDHVMEFLMKIVDGRAAANIIGDTDPLRTMETLQNIESKLVTKHGFSESIEALFGRRIIALRYKRRSSRFLAENPYSSDRKQPELAGNLKLGDPIAFDSGKDGKNIAVPGHNASTTSSEVEDRVRDSFP